jgi:serine/threonine protein kinase
LYYSICGTPEFLAPEKLNLNPEKGKESDVYALGVTMYKMISGMVTFSHLYGNLKQQILFDKPFPIKSGMTSLDDVIMNSLSKNPDDRPTVQDVNSVFSN